jgi:hypothetical protein
MFRVQFQTGEQPPPQGSPLQKAQLVLKENYLQEPLHDSMPESLSEQQSLV